MIPAWLVLLAFGYWLRQRNVAAGERMPKRDKDQGPERPLQKIAQDKEQQAG
jgi:hypothetical protein